MPVDTYKSQRRGGKGITGISTREDDFVKEIFTASTHDTILFFTNKGKMYRLRGFEIPEAGRTARGTAIVNLLNLDAGEKVSAVIPIQNYAEGKYILMSTKYVIQLLQDSGLTGQFETLLQNQIQTMMTQYTAQISQFLEEQISAQMSKQMS